MSSTPCATQATAAAAAMSPVELTLIVAATRNLGIGRAGGLPWTGLRKEMAYFARVTKRADPSLDARDPAYPVSSVARQSGVRADSWQPSRKNAVIMGRKTWDSIPEKFRPLKGRVNIVLSRSHAPVASLSGASGSSDVAPVRLPSLAEALELSKTTNDVGRLFIIGGAEIYKAALEMNEAKRILLTRVQSEFECDTFFPVDLSEGEWVKRSKEELDAWTGETVPDGVQLENGVSYVFEMYERR